MFKKIFNRIFIDGLSGMASGLFATLIIGTIVQQLGNLIGGNIGTVLYQFGKMAAAMTKMCIRDSQWVTAFDNILFHILAPRYIFTYTPDYERLQEV